MPGAGNAPRQGALGVRRHGGVFLAGDDQRGHANFAQTMADVEACQRAHGGAIGARVGLADFGQQGFAQGFLLRPGEDVFRNGAPLRFQP